MKMYVTHLFYELVRDVIYLTRLCNIWTSQTTKDGHVSRFGHLINSSLQGQETHLFFLNHYPPPHYPYHTNHFIP